MHPFLNHPKIILFDGVCNFCNKSVNTIIKHDTKNQFVFASLQSEIGKKIIDYLKIDVQKIDSIIYYEPKIAYYIKSNAALKISNHFTGFWKLTQIFWLIPKSFRDFIYDFIAKNRYKWFGKQTSCIVPNTKIATKFLN